MSSSRNLRNDLDPSRFGEQFGKMLATLGDVRGLTVAVQVFAAGPFLDEGEPIRMIEIDKKIVTNASDFLPSRGDEALQHGSQLGFTSRFGVQMSNNIDFHERSNHFLLKVCEHDRAKSPAIHRNESV